MLNIIAAQQEVANINSSYRLAIQQVVINILFTSNYTEKSEYNRIKYWGKFLSVSFRSVSYVLVLSFYLGSSLLLKIIFFKYFNCICFKNRYYIQMLQNSESTKVYSKKYPSFPCLLSSSPPWKQIFKIYFMPG